MPKYKVYLYEKDFYKSEKHKFEFYKEVENDKVRNDTKNQRNKP